MKALAIAVDQSGLPIPAGPERRSAVWFGRATLPIAVAVALGYYFGAKLGFALTFQPHPVSVLWPPNSILVAALLLTPPRLWWCVLLAAFPAHWIAQLQSDVPPSMVLCWFISNCCEALIGASLVWFLLRDRMRFNRLRNAAIFCLCVVIAGPFLSSFLDGGFVVLNRWGSGTYWELFRIRFASNVLAALTIAPLIVTWATSGMELLRKASVWRCVEGAFVFLGLLLVSFFVLYRSPSGADSSFLYLPLPFLFWAAVRFGSPGSSTAVATMAFLAIWSAAHGHGPFSSGSPEQNALSIQTFLIVVSVPLLFLGALTEERGNVEQRFASAFHSSPDAMLIIRRRDGCIIDANEQFEKIFGYSRGESVHHTIAHLQLDLVPGDLEKVIARSDRDGILRDLETQLRTRDGSVRDALLSVDTAEMAAESCFIVIIRDITEREVAAAALRESEERFQVVADATPVLIWMTGPDKRALFFNKAWVEFTGGTLEQQLGFGWKESIHPDDLESCFRIYSEAFDGRTGFAQQFRLRRHDGEHRWVSAQGVPRYDAAGDFAGYTGSCVDITESITKDEELREIQERMQLTIDALDIGIWEWDPIKDEIHATSARRSLFGWTDSGKLGLEDYISRVHPDDRSRVRRTLKEAVAQKKPYEAEFRVILPNETLRWISARGRFEPDHHGNLTRFVGISIDVTARKQAELEAKQRQDDLGHLSRVALMGEMSASLAHELNQPLSGIVSNASAGIRFIDRGDVDLNEIREILADISEDGRRAGNVVRGIRSMVKKGQPSRQLVNLNDIISHSVQLTSADAHLRSCEVTATLDSTLPPIEIDPIQIQQVLLNLIINGFDAMEEMPAAQRKVEIFTQSRNHGSVQVSVRDHGCGFSKESRERLFEQFFTTKNEGLGMGLAIVRSIVEAHQGAIAAENADGGGALFTVTLPVKIVA